MSGKTYKVSFTCKGPEKVKKNNKSIALNILFLPRQKKEKTGTHFKIWLRASEEDDSFNGGKCWKMLFFYVAVKCLCGLLQDITLDHHGDCYCMNCLYSCRIERELRSYENMCKNHDYCHMVKSEKGKISWNIIKIKNLWRLHSLIMQKQKRCLIILI